MTRFWNNTPKAGRSQLPVLVTLLLASLFASLISPPWPMPSNP